MRFRISGLATLGGVVLLATSLALRWFSVDGPAVGGPVAVFGEPRSGWGLLGHPWLELLAATGVSAGLALVLRFRRGPGPRSTRIVGGAITVAVATLAAVAVRATVAAPSPRATEVGGTSVLSTLATTDRLPDAVRLRIDLDPAIGSWVGLAALLLIAGGLGAVLLDDRRGAAGPTGPARDGVA